jgi:hypothetical protein
MPGDLLLEGAIGCWPSTACSEPGLALWIYAHGDMRSTSFMTSHREARAQGPSSTIFATKRRMNGPVLCLSSRIEGAVSHLPQYFGKRFGIVPKDETEHARRLEGDCGSRSIGHSLPAALLFARHVSGRNWVRTQRSSLRAGDRPQLRRDEVNYAE